MTSYLQAESLENWRSNALATMHIEPTKVERKYVSYDPVPLLRLEANSLVETTNNTQQRSKGDYKVRNESRDSVTTG